MKILDKLERRFGRYAVPNVTVALIFCQVVVYAAGFADKGILEKMVLRPELVLQGEVWRLVSFLLQPPPMNLLFALFFWYLFYIMGTTLENTWGTFRYNMFLLIGYLATVGASFVTPAGETHNIFLEGSVFLAFAFLYPDFQLMLFFVLPVKIKWLARLQWVFYLLAVAFGDWETRLAATAAIANFLLFFGKEIWLRMRTGHRRMQYQAARIQQRDKPRHQCRVCGLTDKMDPRMSFRYCSKCAGSCCYCPEHLQDHEHVTDDREPDKGADRDLDSTDRRSRATRLD